MNKRNALLDLSRVISFALSSLEFIRKTICYADPTFDEQVKRLFLALPSLEEESQQNEIIYYSWWSTAAFLFIYFYISALG